jgi:hypothetical protein
MNRCTLDQHHRGWAHYLAIEWTKRSVVLWMIFGFCSAVTMPWETLKLAFLRRGHPCFCLATFKKTTSHGPPSVHTARLGLPEQPSLPLHEGAPPVQRANMTYEIITGYWPIKWTASQTASPNRIQSMAATMQPIITPLAGSSFPTDRISFRGCSIRQSPRLRSLRPYRLRKRRRGSKQGFGERCSSTLS